MARKRKSRSCSTCGFYIPCKEWKDRLGICSYDDGAITKEVKNCKNWTGRPYKRRAKHVKKTETM